MNDNDMENFRAMGIEVPDAAHRRFVRELRAFAILASIAVALVVWVLIFGMLL